MTRKSGGTKRNDRTIVKCHVLYLDTPWVVGNLAVLFMCHRLHARDCDKSILNDEIKHPSLSNTHEKIREEKAG